MCGERGPRRSAVRPGRPDRSCRICGRSFGARTPRTDRSARPGRHRDRPTRARRRARRRIAGCCCRRSRPNGDGRANELLGHTCRKAGLDDQAWRHGAQRLSLRGGRLRRLTDQPSQDLQVAAIERIDVAAPPALGGIELGGFEQHRQRAKPRVVEDPPERLEPEPAFADVLVPIDAAAAGLLRVVHVKRLQSREPDDPAERVERLAVAMLPSRCRIPRSAGGTCRGRRRRAASRRACR